MTLEFYNAVLVQTVASLIGVFIGALGALAMDRHTVQRRHRQRARTLLRILSQELAENDDRLRAVRPEYEATPWGKSFYLSTIAWETALSSGDLPEILGYELADRLATQYGWLARIRYHVDLLTRLWMAPRDIAGYEEIRNGFRQAILAAMDQAIAGHQEVLRHARKDAPGR